MARKLNEQNIVIDDVERTKRIQASVMKSRIPYSAEDYAYDDRFRPWDGSNPLGVHTSAELRSLLEKDKDIQIDGIVLAKVHEKGGKWKLKPHRIKNRENFLRAWKEGEAKLKESSDLFSMDLEMGGSGTGLGQETIPLLGGPFNKQLYYRDYLTMHGLAFYAFHHDPIANFIIKTTTNFVLGRGFKVVCEEPEDQALWEAFSEANNLDVFMETLSDECAIYGENMIWWLPNRDAKIGYQLKQGETMPKAALPRIRMIDPSAIWEIITYPEDITRVLAYQWIAPTQYQTFSHDDATKTSVPTLKFIYQQIPADQVMHFKVNSVSNEKRGRSDLYPILGYLKRLRDAVSFSLAALQKQAAWSIDTTIEGSQTDVDAYVSAMEALGPVPPAGSDFAHTSKIKREYLSNSVGGGKGGGSTTFEWCLDMIAIGCGIPVSYFGTTAAHGQSRAAAFVGTEPVVKKFEKRQRHIKRILEAVATRFFKEMGKPNAEFEVIFPSLVTQDRSATLADLELAQSAGWISKDRAANRAAKEFDFEDFDYEQERKEMEDQDPAMTVSPLSTPAKATAPSEPNQAPRGVDASDRQTLSQGRGF